LLCNSL